MRGFSVHFALRILAKSTIEALYVPFRTVSEGVFSETGLAVYGRIGNSFYALAGFEDIDCFLPPLVGQRAYQAALRQSSKLVSRLLISVCRKGAGSENLTTIGVTIGRTNLQNSHQRRSGAS
jgi:hypothetical protein